MGHLRFEATIMLNWGFSYSSSFCSCSPKVSGTEEMDSLSFDVLPVACVCMCIYAYI